jgi:hypothetical protein
VNGTVNSVSVLRARSLVSRGLAEYVTEPVKKRGRPKGSKNKTKPETEPARPAVFAEQVYANPDTPVSPATPTDVSDLPSPTRKGEATAYEENKPLHTE